MREFAFIEAIRQHYRFAVLNMVNLIYVDTFESLRAQLFHLFKSPQKSLVYASFLSKLVQFAQIVRKARFFVTKPSLFRLFTYFYIHQLHFITYFLKTDFCRFSRPKKKAPHGR